MFLEHAKKPFFVDDSYTWPIDNSEIPCVGVRYQNGNVCSKKKVRPKQPPTLYTVIILTNFTIFFEDQILLEVNLNKRTPFDPLKLVKILKTSILLSFDEFFRHACKCGILVKFVKTTSVLYTWTLGDYPQEALNMT